MTEFQSNVMSRSADLVATLPEKDASSIFDELIDLNNTNDCVRQTLIKQFEHTKTVDPENEEIRELDPPSLPNQADQRLRDNFLCLQQFEGVVLSVQHDEFTARLVDLSGKSPDEEADFPIAEVSEEDKSYVVPGIVFYWNIYYVDKADGQRTRSFELRFRRLPKWEQSDIEEAKRKAAFIADAIDWK